MGGGMKREPNVVEQTRPEHGSAHGRGTRPSPAATERTRHRLGKPRGT